MNKTEIKIENSEFFKLKDFGAEIEKNKPLGKILFEIFKECTDEKSRNFPFTNDNIIHGKSQKFGFGMALLKFEPGYWDEADVFEDIELLSKPRIVQEQRNFGFLELRIFEDYLDAINFPSHYDLALFSLENKKTILGYYKRGSDLEEISNPKYAVFLARIEGEIIGKVQYTRGAEFTKTIYRL